MRARGIFLTMFAALVLGFVPVLAETETTDLVLVPEITWDDQQSSAEDCQDLELDVGEVSWTDAPMEAVAKPGGPGNICKRYWCVDAGLQCEFTRWSRKGCCLYGDCITVPLSQCPAEEPLPGGACKRQRL